MSSVNPYWEDPQDMPVETCVDKPVTGKLDVPSFLKGIILGFGLAAVASVFFNFFSERRAKRAYAMSPEARLKKQDESGGIIGDLTNLVGESTEAFKDAVQTLDRTFETGVKAIETVQNVINKIRESDQAG